MTAEAYDLNEPLEVHLRDDVVGVWFYAAASPSFLMYTHTVHMRGLHVHSAVRVGVLGWLSPMVLQSQPAKSTSSTSDRLMNV